MKVRSKRSSKVLQKFLPLLIIASMIVALLPVSSGTVSAETGSESVITDYLPTIYETIDANGFKHPGVGLTKEVLENLQTQVRAQKEPWKTYFDQLVASTDPWGTPLATRTVSSKFSQGCWCSQGYNEKFIWDGLTAYTQALMYVITGDEVYRANTMNIIRKWEQKNPAEYAYFVDSHIHTGVPLYRMVTAAEIMRYTSTQTPELAWTDQDTADLTNNVIVPVTETFNHTNGRFMNQHLYPLIGAISGYVFTGNVERYHEAVEWFTVNKTAVDQHINGSIKRLFRLVDTNAATGEKVDNPQVQITEMGRDQAHSTGDVINVAILSRLLQAQGTKVDPVDGTVSTAENAVTSYDFLGKRILAGTDYFARYMNGYDTPWIPTEARMRQDGSPVIYQELNTSYRGRIGGNAYDLYYYYKYEQGLDMEQVAPYYTEMFNKRTGYGWASRDSGGEYWLYIPKEAEAEGATNLPKVDPNPNWKEIELRFTNLDGNSTAMQEGDVSFVRINATESGSKIALVQSDSGSSVLGYKIRTNGAAKLVASGQTITLPDTQGQWRYIYSEGGGLWTLNYFTIIGNGTTVDIDHINVNAANELTPPVFNEGNTALNLFAYVGSEAALHLDFSATDAGPSDVVTYRIAHAPEGAVFDTSTGTFDWNPTVAGTYAFVVEASDGTTISTRDVTVTVANDRQSAVDAVIAPYDANTDYVWATLDTYTEAYDDTMSLMNTATDAEFYQKLAVLHGVVQGLQLTTPLLGDGSINYQGMSLSAGSDRGTYTDNDLSTAGRDVDMDMGPNFRVSASRFGIQARGGFPERGGGITIYGSNDKENWTRLTPGVTPVSTAMHMLAVSPELQNEQFRFLNIQMIQKPYDAPFIELSEFHIFGKRHEVINKIASVSIGSDQASGGRIVMGDTAKLSFQSTEAIQNVKVAIQGVPATVHSEDGLNWTAEAVMVPGTAPGNVTFKLHYQTAEGTDAPETMFVTDGSRLILVDESDVIPNVTSITVVTDSNGRSPADAIATANVLFDNNPASATDYRLNGSGVESWVQFDFGQGGYAQLQYVELLARQDGYYTRINGAVIQGSNDNTTWKTISSGAVSTKDWQILSLNDKQPYRYIRITNGNAWFGNMAEVRFHGTAKVLTKISSVSISSEQAILNRIETGDTVNLAFTSMEPIQTVNVKIQGIDATVNSEDNINWTAEAVMDSHAAPGPVDFSINYQTSEGLDAPAKTSTTDGSSLTLADESDLIGDVTSIADVTDSYGRTPSDAISVANRLFDGEPGTVTDYRLNGSGAGAWVQFDFRGAKAKLKNVELLARQDGYYTRIKGAVIQGSNDNSNWTTITPSAASTKDWQTLMTNDDTSYRYIRIVNGNAWFGNMAEVRFHGDLVYNAEYFDSIVLPDGYTKGSYYLYMKEVARIKAAMSEPGADTSGLAAEFDQAKNLLVPYIMSLYSFEGDANNTFGSIDGTVTGSPAYSAGKVGQAIELNGTNSYVTLSPEHNVSADQITIATWVYWNGSSQWQRIFDFGNNTSQYMFLTPRSGNNTLHFGIKNGGGEQIVQTSQLSANEWVHVAVTLGDGSLKLYVNGELKAENNNNTIKPSDFKPSKNYVGKSQWPDPLFSGKIDEFGVYESVLSADEIKALYNNTLTWLDNSLIALLLDEAAAVNTEFYEEESVEALQAAVFQAESVSGNPDATQEEIDTAADSLKTVLDGLIYKIMASNDPAEPNGTNGWYKAGPVIVALSTHGTAEYSLDDGATWQEYATPITFDQEGKNTFSYRSKNEAGIAGHVQTVDVNVDMTIPITTAAVSPAEPDGLNGWFKHPVTLSLTANDNLSGVAKTEYSLDGGSTWQAYTEPVMITQDGKYTVSYRSTDIAGNVETDKSISFDQDTTAPTITVTGVVYGTYDDSINITPIVALDDNLSGVDSSKTTVTLDGYAIQPGETIPLFTLPLGSHTLVVTASDMAGNTSSQTVIFQTTTSIASLQALVTRFTDAEWIDGDYIWIDNMGIAKSLQSKLAANELAALVNQVQALRGKHITEKAAQYLLRDAEYLLNNQ